MNRELTEQEKHWLIRGLKTLESGEYRGGGNWVEVATNQTLPLDPPIDSKPFLDQIDGLRVVSVCGCNDPNCHTIHFQNRRQGRAITLVTYHTDDGRLLNIDVDEQTGRLLGLEII